MRKRRSPEKYIRAFQLLQYGVCLELIMIALYRWGNVSWLLYPIIVTFVCLIVMAVLLAPRTFVAVFGAIGASAIFAILLMGLPILLLSNIETDPNPLIIFLFVAWILITVVILTLVYVKVEKHLLKRVGIKTGRLKF